jgi:hypothetical protein
VRTASSSASTRNRRRLQPVYFDCRRIRITPFSSKSRLFSRRYILDLHLRLVQIDTPDLAHRLGDDGQLPPLYAGFSSSEVGRGGTRFGSD